MGKKMKKLLEIVDFLRIGIKKGPETTFLSNWCQEVQGFQPN